MRNISVKVNGVDTLDASDYNSVQNELENVITSSGQTLDPAGGPDTDITQFGKAISISGSTSIFYKDTGVANSYILSKTTNFDNVPAYTDGMIAIFVPSNNNLGASTVNISGLGVKNIVRRGSPLTKGQLRDDKYSFIQYDLNNGVFELIFLQLSPREQQYDVVIDSAGNGADFAALSDYLNGTPVAGDRVLVKGNHTALGTLTFPSNVSFKFDNDFFLSTPNTTATKIIIQSVVTFEGLFRVFYDTTFSAAGTIIDLTNTSSSNIGDILILDGGNGSLPTNTLVDLTNSISNIGTLNGGGANVTTPITSGGTDNAIKVYANGRQFVPTTQTQGAGAGIDFSNAGTVGRILTDYQEGSIPAVLSLSVSGSYTHSGGMTFIKIGNYVHVNGTLGISGATAPVGVLLIDLPLPTTNVVFGLTRIDSFGGTLPGQLHIEKNSNSNVKIMRTDDSGNRNSVLASDLDTFFNIFFSFSYHLI